MSSRRSGGSFNRSSSRYTTRPAAPPPVMRPSSRPSSSLPATVGTGLPTVGLTSQKTGLAEGIAQGMTFGAGSALAHRAIDSFAGPRKIEVQHSENSENQKQKQGQGVSPCHLENERVTQCLRQNRDHSEKCASLLDDWSTCLVSSGL
jgi:hypothetical protein